LILWGHVFRRRSYGNGVIALLYLAPLVALAMWPWLWHDTIRRLASYVMFYLEHQKTAVFYLGQKWGYTYGPPAPWHYPWTVLAAGTPEWFLLFAVLGMAAVFAKSFRSGSALLITVLALVWPAISSMPSSPKYDGERLFFPTFVFLALLGGIGFQRLLETITRNSVPSSRRKGIGLALLSVVCLWAGMDLALSHPNELNYFNFAVGRPQGALRKGFETSYWGESLNEDACAYLSRRIQPGDKTLVLAMNPQCFVDLQRWGKLPAGAEFTSGELPVDWIVMQIRQGFMGQLETNLFRSGRAVQVFTAQGVPRLALFDGSLLHRDGETTVAQSAVPPAPSADSARTSQTVTTSTVARQGSETTATTASQSQP